jgi:hypothetical protein
MNVKPKLYLETTIASYFIARPSRDLITAAHQQITQEWWEERRQGYEVFVSQLVLQEANMGDAQASQRRLQVLEGFPVLELNEAVVALARALVDQGAVPPQAVGDAVHVAVAAVHGMDYLITWNMKHLANAVMRNAIATVCLNHGYQPPVICTPEELSED